jgi:hypothetical protein
MKHDPMKLWSSDFSIAEFQNTTHNWIPSDSKDAFIEKGNPYTKDSFNYKFNDHGFRCDDFNNPSQHRYRVLFAGCSHTTGIGLPVEHTWAYRLLEKIQSHFSEKLPYWNVGVGGVSNDFLARTLARAIPFLKPQVVILLAPTFSRREWIFDDEITQVMGGVIYPNSANIAKKETIKMLNMAANLDNFNKNLTLIHNICTSNSSTLFWNAESCHTAYDYQQIQMSVCPELQHEWRGCLGFMDKARDSLHAGPKSNEYFVERIAPDILLPMVTKLRQHQ